MANELKTVGLTFKADGAVDFRKTMQQIKTAVNENSNAFKLAKESWDDSTSSAKKLQDRQEYLQKQTDIYTDKVTLLSLELDDLESAENRNENAIRQKQNQLTSAQISLKRYQNSLASVNEELENLDSKERMEQLDASMDDLTASAKETESAFKALKSTWNENTKSIQKYKAEQQYLTDQSENYEKQVKNLESQLWQLESAEERDEKAIREKRTELNETKTTLNEYKNSLDSVEEKLKSGAARTESYEKKLESFGDKASSVGDKLSGISTGAAGIIAAAAATVPATEEYRKIMGSLEISSQKAGYSADQTMESYKTLYGVLGDDQTAATTTANLQALRLSQEKLTTIINGTIGAWSTYGDSIPIDGLAESINETVKTGTVTGTFADMLNWAGTSEDAFNEKLEACSTESERVNLVLQEMSKQGLTEAGIKWQENNQNLVDGHKATADFQAATAELADTIAPIISQITEIVADLIQKFNGLDPEAQKSIATFILMVAAMAPVMKGIAGIAGGIKTLMSVFTGLSALLSVNPFVLFIAAIALVVAGLVTAYKKVEWFRDAVDTALKAVAEIAEWVMDKLKKVFSFGGKKKGSKISVDYDTAPMMLEDAKMPVQWFAYGGILNRPTLFGSNGNNLFGGGEAGKEAVLPIDLLRNYIREENQANNETLVALIADAIQTLRLTAENNIYIGDKKTLTALTELVLKKMSDKMLTAQAARGM